MEKNAEVPYTNTMVKLVGEDGNAFAILGRVRRAIQHSNLPELEETFMHKATRGDCSYMLQSCMLYVSVE